MAFSSNKATMGAGEIRQKYIELRGFGILLDKYECCDNLYEYYGIFVRFL